MDEWIEKKILILGTTYPSYSKKYVENVCTGGLEAHTNRMVRIHPVPLRYLEKEHKFKKFQWVTLRAAQHPSDPRPESLRIDPNSIQLGSTIPASRTDERRIPIESSPHVIRSVEALKERWEKDQTSMGIIQPLKITGVQISKRSEQERTDWYTQEKALLSQKTFEFERPPKPLDFPEVKFDVSWICNDERCKGHTMGIMQWGLHELFRKLKNDVNGRKKVLDSIMSELDLEKRDVFFFLGNFRGKMFNFGLMDSYSPKKRTPAKKSQLSLFNNK